MYLPPPTQALQTLVDRGVQPDVPMNAEQLEAFYSMLTFLRGITSDEEGDLHHGLLVLSYQTERRYQKKLREES